MSGAAPAPLAHSRATKTTKRCVIIETTATTTFEFRAKLASSRCSSHVSLTKSFPFHASPSPPPFPISLLPSSSAVVVDAAVAVSLFKIHRGDGDGGREGAEAEAEAARRWEYLRRAQWALFNFLCPLRPRGKKEGRKRERGEISATAATRDEGRASEDNVK